MQTELKFALRRLRKNPGFTVVAVLTLALGIGAISAIFSVVNAVLLRPLPYEEPERLVAVTESNPRLGWPRYTASLANYLDWREQNSVFDALGATATGGMATLQGDHEPEQVRTAYVSANFFSLLGVGPLVGRAFRIEEEQRGRADVVLLSERLWRSRFGASRSLVDRTVRLNGRSFVVVGIMPDRLALYEPSRIEGWESGLSHADVWRPLVVWPDKLKWRNMREFLVLGRLKPGITVETAQNQMTVIARGLERRFPDSNRGWEARVTSWGSEITARSRPTLYLLLGAAGLALLIATANVANLLLTQAVARRREFGIRVALGARSSQLVRQLLSESLLLACAGGIGGLLLGLWGLHLLSGAIPANLPRADEIGLDGRVLAFTVAVTFAAGVAFGLTPWIHLRRTGVGETLRQEGRSVGPSPTGNRIRQALVGSEIALVTLLLVGAGLLTRSFWRLNQVDPGFDPERVVAVDVALGGARYTNGQAMVHFVERLLPRLAEIPGARSVATANGLPLDPARENMDIAVALADRPPTDPAERLVAGLRQVSPAYFTTLGIPMLRGRHFTEHDNGSAPPVAIVNQTFVHRFLAEEDPLGRRIASPDFGHAPCEIVGVVQDVKHQGLDLPSRPEVFLPHLQSCFSQLAVVVRGDSNPEETVRAVKAAVAAVDREVAVHDPRPLTAQVAAAGSARKFAMLLMGLLAGLSLVLGTMGVYGVLSCGVAEREKELGIRMALGARRGRLIVTVILRGMTSVLGGATIGFAAALVLTRSLRAWLFEIGPTDPVTFGLVSVLLGGVAVVACYLPARRAATVDPMVALRTD